MFHRAGWLIRDTQATGKRRMWSEIGAMALDPITGANRFASGDASRVSDKPSEFVPSSLSGVAAAGVLWRGTQASAFTAAGDPFLEVDAYYGDTNVGRSNTPYDAFWIRMRFGGGSSFSEARVRGRLTDSPSARASLTFPWYRATTTTTTTPTRPVRRQSTLRSVPRARCRDGQTSGFWDGAG